MNFLGICCLCRLIILQQIGIPPENVPFCKIISHTGNPLSPTRGAKRACIHISISFLLLQILHGESSDDWTLQIKYVQKRDNGTYECQVRRKTLDFVSRLALAPSFLFKTQCKRFDRFRPELD